MTQKHSWDEIAQDVADYIEMMVEDCTNAIMENGQMPFASNASEDEKRAYYMQKLFNPDGSPNERGRNELIDRQGIETYAKVVDEVKRTVAKRQQQGQVTK
jgi:hypothetical protein